MMANMQTLRDSGGSAVREVCRLFQALPGTTGTLQVCPFCGCSYLQTVQVDIAGWMVECFDCHTTGPVRDSVTGAAKAWNTRRSQ